MVLNRLGEPLTSKHVWERPSKRPLSSFMSSSKMDCGGLRWLQTESMKRTVILQVTNEKPL